MKIKRITSQHRRDFSAIFECEHCQVTYEVHGCYDDDNFHRNVIPKFKCKSCGQQSPEDYRPLTTKYNEHEQV